MSILNALKSRFSYSFVYIFLIFLLVSCSGQNKSGSKDAAGVSQTETLSKNLSAGQEIYKKYCLSCHQANGKGVSGMYPPLAGNPNLKLSNDSLIYIVLLGKAGKIQVNGKEYVGIMAPHNYLSDEQVSNVLNFLLNGLNNFDMQVKSSEVSQIRTKIK